MSEKCNACKKLLSNNRIFLINKNSYCGETCFKIAFELAEYQKKISKFSIN